MSWYPECYFFKHLELKTNGALWNPFWLNCHVPTKLYSIILTMHIFDVCKASINKSPYLFMYCKHPESIVVWITLYQNSLLCFKLFNEKQIVHQPSAWLSLADRVVISICSCFHYLNLIQERFPQFQNGKFTTALKS